MNEKLDDFIFSVPEFNDCTFCKQFGFNKDCPIKNMNYGDNPSKEQIETGMKLCKGFVLMNLKKKLVETENIPEHI